MRIIDGNGEWDFVYESISLKVEANRLYAYPLFTNILPKPVCLKVLVSKEAGYDLIKDIRKNFLKGKRVYYINSSMEEVERAEIVEEMRGQIT